MQPDPSPLIAVIDDDADVRLSLEDLLLSMDYRTRIYDSADSFLQDCHCRPACIISDIQMPGMSGIALARHLRSSAPDLPVILITAFPSHEIARQATESGADSFLRKPFDPDDLIHCLDTALAKAGDSSTG